MAVYLDCAATTPVDPRVRAAVITHLEDEFGNAGSRSHEFGQRARAAVERARQQVAAAVDASRAEVVFTSGATESDNLAILGLAAHGIDMGRRHAIVPRIEHHAVIEPFRELERRGFEIDWLDPEPGGSVSARSVARALRPDTLLVSVMHVNNETGIVQPIAEIAETLGDRPAFFHVDAAQGFGLLADQLRNRRIDLISVSGHKIHAPKGVGALIARRRGRERPPLTPLMHGGGQELGLRPGTLAVPLIVGLGLAAELAAAEADQRRRACAAFRARLLAGIEPLGPVLHGDQGRCAPHILNLSIPGVESEELIEAWAPWAAISPGAACASQTYTCSHVLSAMRLPEQQKAGAVRLSWSHETPLPDFAPMIEAVERIAALA